MSDTPISNAAASTTMYVDGEPVVEIKICRELERKLQKAQADAAAMRELLKACAEFGVEHYATCPEDDTCDCEHIKGIDAALSADCGSSLQESSF